MATPSKAYPRSGFYVAGVPHVIHEFPSKASAEAFVSEHPQAFSLDASDAMPDAIEGTEVGAPLPTVIDSEPTETGDAGEGA